MLISREQIAKRIVELGADISRDFAGQPVILVGVLKGSAIFLADLARQVTLDATFDFIGVSSYGNRPSPTRTDIDCPEEATARASAPGPEDCGTSRQTFAS